MSSKTRVLFSAGFVLAAGSAVAAALLFDGVLSRRAGTERAPIDQSTIVMFGDSITEEGDWDRLLPDRAVSNQGFSGYTTAQLQQAAKAVAADRPAMVFILTGTNDIRDGHPPAWTRGELLPILDAFDTSPSTIVVLQTVLPRSDAPDEVMAANRMLEELAADRGLPLLDLHVEFDDGAGGLRVAETRDGLHLSDAGYERWRDALAMFLAEQG